MVVYSSRLISHSVESLQHFLAKYTQAAATFEAGYFIIIS